MRKLIIHHPINIAKMHTSHLKSAHFSANRCALLSLELKPPNRLAQRSIVCCAIPSIPLAYRDTYKTREGQRPRCPYGGESWAAGTLPLPCRRFCKHLYNLVSLLSRGALRHHSSDCLSAATYGRWIRFAVRCAHPTRSRTLL